MKKRVKKYAKMRPLTNQDGEVRELTRADFLAMRPTSEVLSPTLYKALCDLSASRKAGQRGLQKAPKKVSVTVRYSPEVVEYFKLTGKGWQTKMDEALKEWIKKRKRVA